MQAQQPLPTSSEFIDLRVYLTALRRRRTVIAVLAALGLGLGLGYSKLQTPLYTATAEVLINPPPGSSTLNLNNTISVGTEAQVVKSAPVADVAAKSLGSPPVSTQLLKHVSVRTSPSSFVMGISYSDPDSSQAAAGANAFANAYLEYRQQLGDDQIAQQQDSIGKQIAQLQSEQKLENKALEASTSGTITYRNAQDALNQLSVRLAVLASSIAELPTFVNPGQVILPAVAPRAPSSPKVPMNAAIGLLLGLFCGIVAAIALNRMDDRVHAAADLPFYLDVPVVASVPLVRGRNRSRATQLKVHLEPRSPTSEAYRTIRTSVLSMAGRRNMKIFAFASPLSGEGKSMTCANVAAALGQSDRRVLVLSADLRKPTIHEFFFASGRPGLSEVLEGKIPFHEAVERTEIGNVWVLSGGQFPANPSELLQSSKMADLIQSVAHEFDFVIIDCPPILGLADCLAVLPLVDAVLLVIQAGRTRGDAIAEASDRLERVGVSIDGVILNKVNVRRGYPGYGMYGYYVASQEHLRPDDREVTLPPNVVPRTRVTPDANLEGWMSPAGSSPSNGEAAVRAGSDKDASSADEV